MPLTISIAPKVPELGDYRLLATDRTCWARHVAAVIQADPRLRGTVLDVGCRDRLPRPAPLEPCLYLPRQLDGVDPSDEVFKHERLTNRWHALFEEADIPGEAYDAVTAFWVAEHVANPRAFLESVYRVLKPGGVFFASTPHAWHPYAFAVRAVEIVSLKRFYASRTTHKVNDYPAYYRLNSRRALRRHAGGIGFASAEVHYFPTLGWDSYFPRPLRFLPRTYDRLLGIRFRSLAQQMLIKLEKPGSEAGAVAGAEARAEAAGAANA